MACTGSVLAERPKRADPELMLKVPGDWGPYEAVKVGEVRAGDARYVKWLSVARAAVDAAGDSPEAKAAAADVWIVRRRLATKEELAAMAVQAEQGDEACLCGKKSPTIPEVERQAHLLAEATLLYQLASDKASALRTLSLLRNVAHKAEGNDAVWQLHLRMTMWMEGPEAALREASAIHPSFRRLYDLTVAAGSWGLQGKTKRVLEAVDAELRELPEGGTRERGVMAYELVRAEVVFEGNRDGVRVSELPKDRQAMLRREMVEMAWLGGKEGLVFVPKVEGGTEWERAYQKGGKRAVVDRLAKEGGEELGLRVYTYASAGTYLGTRLPVDEVGSIANEIQDPLLRGTFLAAGLKVLTAGSTVRQYEDALNTVSVPEVGGLSTKNTKGH